MDELKNRNLKHCRENSVPDLALIKFELYFAQRANCAKKSNDICGLPWRVTREANEIMRMIFFSDIVMLLQTQ